MAIITEVSQKINVVDAARRRVANVFSTAGRIFLSFSGGKDSICLANIVYEYLITHPDKAKKLTVIFIDEEAIFNDVERICLVWRDKFLSVGAKFEWYCMEFRHYNCFNSLESDESFITWDRNKKNKWVRNKPEFCTQHHKDHIRGESYQEFLNKITLRGGITQLIGIRVSESVQRSYSVASSGSKNNYYPIYDWSTNDIWLYIRDNKLDFPIEYMYMYQLGYGKREMRISQFFSVDTARILVSMGEFYPDLMNKIVEREPNAYMASLYWDSELFRRIGKSKSKNDDIDYETTVLGLLKNLNSNFEGEGLKNARRFERLVFSEFDFMGKNEFKRVYLALTGGDPKSRVLRAVMIDCGQRRKSVNG